MAVEKKFITIPFTGGLDEGKDSHVVEPPLVKRSENFVSNKQGSLQVRDSYASVETGVPASRSAMYRFKEDVVVLSDQGYGVFDTSSETYRAQGETLSGSKAVSSGLNNTLLGGHHSMVASLPGTREIAVGFITTNPQKENTTHVRVYSVEGETLVYEQDLADRYLLDMVGTSTGAALLLRKDGILSDPDNRTFELVFLTESGSTYSLTTYSITVSGIGTPRGIRQGQLVNRPSTDTVWAIVNFLPGSRTDTQYGATYVTDLDMSTGVSALGGEIVSDGTVAQVARDGSAMVACGWDSFAVQPLFMTCTQQTGDVYAFTHNGTVATVGNKIYETKHDFGVPYWASSPSADKLVWKPVDDTGIGGSGPGTVNLTTGITYPGDAFASFDSYGHNFMYGWVQFSSTDQRYVFGWHGISTWASARRAHVVDASFEVHRDRPKLLGCVFVKASRSGTTFTVLGSTRAHSCHLLSRPVATSSQRWDIPVAAASKWFYAVQDVEEPESYTTGFLTFRIQNEPYLVQDQGLQYLCGAILDLDSSTNDMDVSTRCLFGQDQVMPNTSPFAVLDRTPLLTQDGDVEGVITPMSDDDEWRLFDVHMGGVAATLGGYTVGCTRWAARDIDALYDGTRGADLTQTNLGQSNALNWNTAGRRAGPLRETAAMWIRILPPDQVSAQAPGYLLVDSGRPGVYDGSNLFPLDWYLPPQPVLQRETPLWGTRNQAADRTSSVTACWVFRDAYGVTWRSAPGLTATYGLKRWRGEAATVDSILYLPNNILTIFDRPLPLSRGMRGKVGIEYYVDSPAEEDASPNTYTGDGQLKLYGWCDVQGATEYPSALSGTAPDDDEVYRDFGLSLGYRVEYIGGTTILLYTTGGVLPDEPPVGANYMTMAAGRVWYIRDGKAFFSKQVSQNKPVGFNANLYIDSPNGDNLVAVSHMDEYVVLFSKNNVFVSTGTGPNDLGSGQSYYPIEVASDVGCWNPSSVLSTKHGVFFAGPDTLYLLRRDMQIVRIGNIEDSISTEDIRFAVHDRANQRCLWFVPEEGDPDNDRLLVFEYDEGLWHVWKGSDIGESQTGVWTNSGTYLLTAAGAIKKQDPTAGHGLGVLETGWIHLGQTAGYKRFRDCYVISRTTEEDPKAYFYVDFAYDYDPTFFQTEEVDTALMDPDHDIARLKPQRQKCASFKMRIRTQAVSSVLSHVGVEVGVKMLGNKVPRP